MPSRVTYDAGGVHPSPDAGLGLPLSEPQPDEFARLLQAAGVGDKAAAEKVGALVYGELRAIAKAVRRGLPRQETMQTTALVNQAYLKMMGQGSCYEGERHFYVVAAKAMRQLLIDYARTRGRQKRKAAGERIPLDDVVEQIEQRDINLLDLDEALIRLHDLDQRKARVVELRFFGGLDIERTAQLLGVSHATVERDWTMAKAWLRRELGGAEPGP